MNTLRLHMFLCYVIASIIHWDIVGGRYLLRRHKREEGSEGAQQGSFSLPSPENRDPYPAIGSSNLAPTFPFTHSFSNGMDINKGDITEMSGHLNIPIPGFGLWDLKGHQVAGPSHIWYNYGHFLSPANPYHMSAQDAAVMATSSSEGANGEGGKEGQEAKPVVKLPAGFTPANCVPPMCNPFMHAFDFGAQVEPGDNAVYDGSLDFPFKDKDGTIRRFPLSGGFQSGPQPISVLYGQAMNPVNPFPNHGKHEAANAQSQLFHDSINHHSSQTAAESPSFQPFVLPASLDHQVHLAPAEEGQPASVEQVHTTAATTSPHDGYFHGDHNLVMPPAIPS